MGKEVGKSMTTVDERVKKIIAEQLGVEEEEVTLEAHFVEDLGADSLDTVELVMALEEEFEIEIPDEAHRNFWPETARIRCIFWWS